MFYNVLFQIKRSGKRYDNFSLLMLINVIMRLLLLKPRFFVSYGTFNFFCSGNAPAIKMKQIQDIRGNNSNEIRLNFRGGIV
ncbi:hypothetical protein BN136_3460 [Cronobacter universalis NCTC 9529]|uniref:Uncharacterized protein n=1 Tax=Cronobacter universalis NCTC 9529 TaxID=1074000 RepID=A0AAC8VU88_9ENTR|nr:hypothetical protein AFK65_20455 [Cronobacter universalis NCTC 9529]CCK17450.1 hypothetical protein BN136_3460 [Cronobacter universalis NCTC 9529]